MIKYTGYKSEGLVVKILRTTYPKFILHCERDNVAGTYLSMIRIISEKVHYPINLHNLSHKTGSYEWIPATRNDELNGLLNYIEEHPEIPLMSEL